MGKGILSTLLIAGLLFFCASCKKDNRTNETCTLPTSQCFKGRLEISDICGNYTIKVLEGKLDTCFIQASWQHPYTKLVYQNVFSLGNICSFPSSLKQGDEFYFTIRDQKQDPNCVQCLAYAPTPGKRLSITVSASPCGNTK